MSSLLSTNNNLTVNIAKNAYYKALSLPSQFVNEDRKVLLHELYPSNFPYYFMAFELENIRGMTTDRMVFPILPTSYTGTNNIVTSVQKTAGGIIDQFNSTLAPMTLNIQGNFGVSFKLMKQPNIKDLDGMSENLGNTANFLNEKWKNDKGYLGNPLLFTGFRAFNELKRICDKSRTLDNTGQPYKTIFYNLAFSSQYYVRIINFNEDMNVNNNFFHNFNLQMRVIGIANGNLLNSVTLPNVESGVNDIVGSFNSLTKTIKNNL